MRMHFVIILALAGCGRAGPQEVVETPTTLSVDMSTKQDAESPDAAQLAASLLDAAPTFDMSQGCDPKRSDRQVDGGACRCGATVECVPGWMCLSGQCVSP